MSLPLVYSGVFVCMQMSTFFSRVQINRIWFANPACSQLSGKIIFSLSPFAPENFWSRETCSTVPSRPALARSFSTFGLNLVLTHRIFLAFRDGFRSLKLSTSIESVPKLSGREITYRWRSLPEERLPAQSQYSSK